MPRVTFVDCVGKKTSKLIKKRSPSLYGAFVYKFEEYPIGDSSNKIYQKVFKKYIDRIINDYDLGSDNPKKLDCVNMINLLFSFFAYFIDDKIEENTSIRYYINKNDFIGYYTVCCSSVHSDKTGDGLDIYYCLDWDGKIIGITTNANTIYAKKLTADILETIANAILSSSVYEEESGNWEIL